jgi:dienelactone hydrolase
LVVVSGDGGFVHLAPAVAEFLGSKGYFVVGIDAKAYLSSFTRGTRTLTPAEIPGDFQAFVNYARQGRVVKVALIGISEGAGLSVLAATDPALQPSLTGVVALGLPDVNELGWRWRDSIIYLTHEAPDEPSFHAADYVAKLATLPLVAIHSTHDEFVTVETVRRVLGAPGPTRKLWLIEAGDHRFSNRQLELQARLIEALEWIKASPR